MLTFKHFGHQDKNKLPEINLPTYTCHQRREENKFSSTQILNTNSWTFYQSHVSGIMQTALVITIT